MALSGLLLFDGLSRKMNYLDKRNEVIATNIANVDNPNYKERDIEAFDFKDDVIRDLNNKISPAVTNRRHINHMLKETSGSNSRALRSNYESKPTGNDVNLEEQAAKVAQIQSQHELVTAIYQKNMKMMRMALGSKQ